MNGSDTSFRTQQPDSTMILEPSSKEKPSFSFDSPSAMSSTSCVSTDRGQSSKRPLPFRSSVISVDYNSSVFEDSDCMINDIQTPTASHRLSSLAKPTVTGDNGRTFGSDQSNRDSPSTYSFTSPSRSVSKNATAGPDDSNLFFSPKRPEAAVQRSGSSSTAVQTSTGTEATENMEPDDFYIDDFDIDDFNESDIPDYFDEPTSSSASRQVSSAVNKTVREGGSSKSMWDEKRAETPTPAPKPTMISSPGKQTLMSSHLNPCFLISNHVDFLEVLVLHNIFTVSFE